MVLLLFRFEKAILIPINESLMNLRIIGITIADEGV
jgi:hypothetical protein